MVRRSGAAVARGTTRVAAAPAREQPPPVPHEPPNEFGTDTCPECRKPFNSSDLRPVQESCRHVKCRQCLITYPHGCAQCKSPKKSSLPRAAAASLLKESSKRKPTREFTAKNAKQAKFKELDEQRDDQNRVETRNGYAEIPQGGATEERRNSSRSRKPNRFFQHGAEDRESRKNSAIANVKLNDGSVKTFGRNDAKKNVIPIGNTTFPVTIATHLSNPPQLNNRRLEKSPRLSSLRSSVGNSTVTSEEINSPNFIEDKSTISPRVSQPVCTKTYGKSSANFKRPRLEPFIQPINSKELINSTILLQNRLAGEKQCENMVAHLKDPLAPNCHPPHQSKDPLGSHSNDLLPTHLRDPLAPTCVDSLPSTSKELPLLAAKDILRKNGETITHAVFQELSVNEIAGPSSAASAPSTSRPLFIVPRVPNQDTSKPATKKKKKRAPVVILDHITIISDAGKLPMYQCDVCLKKFKTKAHIKYHEFCQNGEKPFKCEKCGQGFIAKSHYEYHLRTHTGERPYVCPECGKGFNQRGKVTRHMRSHTGEKPFVCPQCGRGFANAQAMRSHFLIHTGERPFACEFCNKRFTGMTNLKKHVITHTGERPFMCVHCGKSFGLKWTLDLHLRTHSSERPYACDQCTRAFSNSKDLRRHLVIHSGERPFKCWICGTAFRRKDNLDRHIKNTHNQPKEVAKQLANEAAAEYLASTKGQKPPLPILPRIVNSSNHTRSETVTRPSEPDTLETAETTSDSIPGPSHRRTIKKVKKLVNKAVIITAAVSPSTSPMDQEDKSDVPSSYSSSESHQESTGTYSPTTPPQNDQLPEVHDTYILPNDQTDFHPESLADLTGAVEAKIEVLETIVNCAELNSFTELRTVPFSEYHSLEAVKLLEKAKSTPPPSNEGPGLEKETLGVNFGKEEEINPVEPLELVSVDEKLGNDLSATSELLPSKLIIVDPDPEPLEPEENHTKEQTPSPEEQFPFDSDEAALFDIPNESLFGFYGPQDSTGSSKSWICGTAFRRKDILDRHIKNTHNQPKEVANQLANEAAAEHLASTKDQKPSLPILPRIVNSSNHTSLETVTRPSEAGTLETTETTCDSIPHPSHGRTIKKVKKLVNKAVIITAAVSPSTSPMDQDDKSDVPSSYSSSESQPESPAANSPTTPVQNDQLPEVQDTYIHPNDQTDFHPESLADLTGAVEAKIEAPETIVNCAEANSSAEHRAVPFSEYHNLEAVKLLEKAKSTPPPSNEGPGLEKEALGVKFGKEEEISPVEPLEVASVDEKLGNDLLATSKLLPSKLIIVNPDPEPLEPEENHSKEHTPSPEEQFPFVSDESALFDIPNESLFGFYGPQDSADSSKSPQDNIRVIAGTHIGIPEDESSEGSDIMIKLGNTIENGVIREFSPSDEKENEFSERDAQVALIKEMILEAIDDETLKHQKVKASFENHTGSPPKPLLVSKPLPEDDDGLVDIDSEEDEYMFEMDYDDKFSDPIKENGVQEKSLDASNSSQVLGGNVHVVYAAAAPTSESHNEECSDPIKENGVKDQSLDSSNSSQVLQGNVHVVYAGAAATSESHDEEFSDPIKENGVQDKSVDTSTSSEVLGGNVHAVDAAAAPTSESYDEECSDPIKENGVQDESMDSSNSSQVLQGNVHVVYAGAAATSESHDEEFSDPIKENGVQDKSVDTSTSSEVLGGNVHDAAAAPTSESYDEECSDPIKENGVQDESMDTSTSSQVLGGNVHAVDAAVAPTSESYDEECSDPIKENGVQDEFMDTSTSSEVLSGNVHVGYATAVPTVESPDEEFSDPIIENGVQDQSPDTSTLSQVLDGNLRVVYAAAAPTSESHDGECSDPIKENDVQDKSVDTSTSQILGGNVHAVDTAAAPTSENHDEECSDPIKENGVQDESMDTSTSSEVLGGNVHAVDTAAAPTSESLDEECSDPIKENGMQDECMDTSTSSEVLRGNVHAVDAAAAPTSESHDEECSDYIKENGVQDESMDTSTSSQVLNGNVHVGYAAAAPTSVNHDEECSDPIKEIGVKDQSLDSSSSSQVLEENVHVGYAGAAATAECNEEECSDPIKENGVQDESMDTSTSSQVLDGSVHVGYAGAAATAECHEEEFSDPIKENGVQDESLDTSTLSHVLSGNVHVGYAAAVATAESPDEEFSDLIKENGVQDQSPDTSNSSQLLDGNVHVVYAAAAATAESHDEKFSDPIKENGVQDQSPDTSNSSQVLDGNVHVVYAAAAATAESHDEKFSDPIKENGVQHQSPDSSASSQILDGNLRVVYAAAAATAESPDEESGLPGKIRLLFAEALGYGGEESNQLQFYYASATPDQQLSAFDGSVQNVQFINPALYFVPNEGVLTQENVSQCPQVHQMPTGNPDATLPVHVVYNDNTALAQTVVPHHPDILSLIHRAKEMQNFMPPHQQHHHYDLHQMFASEGGQQHVNTAEEVNRVYSQVPSTSHPQMYPPGHVPSTSHHQIQQYGCDRMHRLWGTEATQPQETDTDGLRTLARAACARRIAMQEESEATIRAATAIAAVGEHARQQRLRDLREQGQSPNTSASEQYFSNNTYHRGGPRKHYLSQLSSKRPGT